MQKNIWSKSLLTLSYGFAFMERKLLWPKTEQLQYERVRPWFADDGDRSLRLDYPLNEASLVMDLGGFEGQWSSDIFAKYLSKIYVFEPYLPFAEKIRKRFTQNPKIEVFAFGLGPRSETVDFFPAENSSSIFKESAQREQIDIIAVKDFFREHQIDKVDLIKINIEGAEYDLMEALLEEGLITRFGNIQIQFHDFFPDAEQRMKKIQERLSHTHTATYQYEFVWENWKLKGN